MRKRKYVQKTISDNWGHTQSIARAWSEVYNSSLASKEAKRNRSKALGNLQVRSVNTEKGYPELYLVK